MRRRILLLSPFAAVRDAGHGGGRAIHGLAGELTRRHDVVLLHLEPGANVDPELAGRCVEVHSLKPAQSGAWSRRARGALALARGRSLWAAEIGVASLQRRVRDLADAFRPDVIQVEHGILGDALGAAGQGRLRVLTVHDPALSQRESLALRREGLPLAHRLDAAVSLRQERRVLALADAVVVFSERDRMLLAPATPPSTQLVTIALGWDVPAAGLDPVGVQPATLVFVGSFVHPPNVEAAVTLAQRILPRVRVKHPHARLDIVGTSPPAEVRALACEFLEVHGSVSSVTPYLDRAAVVVAPMAIGGGMRVKVLEALAAGKAVVASSRAVEGLTARSGRELLVADGDADTAAAITRLLADEQLRRRLAAGARTWALRELAWSTMADRYDELYARLGATR
ncbi:MAG TPA: glycosyltransferase family 4 protein [Solirubrobacteraceae bacterium]|nr:glycosyltransferase family 4 protein [Solirubrobacteraceae bacterium]